MRARRGGVGRAFRLTALLAGLAAVVALAGPWRSSVTDAFGSARKKVAPRFESVNPVKAEATSSQKDHGAGLAIDTGSNTYWAEAAKGNGEGQKLSVTFDPPVDLAKVGFTVGAAGEDFLKSPRPRQVRLAFTPAPGGSVAPPAKELNLKDTAEFQTHDVDAKAVTRVEIEILSTYLGQGGDACAITDLQFFARS
jgi:hypothetical protein